MAKSSAIHRDSKLVVEDDLVPQAQAHYNYKRVSLRSKFPARVRVRGPQTGELYEAQKAGDLINADERDVKDLLQKRVGESSCCGGSKADNFVFELADKRS